MLLRTDASDLHDVSCRQDPRSPNRFYDLQPRHQDTLLAEFLLSQASCAKWV